MQEHSNKTPSVKQPLQELTELKRQHAEIRDELRYTYGILDETRANYRQAKSALEMSIQEIKVKSKALAKAQSLAGFRAAQLEQKQVEINELNAENEALREALRLLITGPELDGAQ